MLTQWQTDEYGRTRKIILNSPLTSNQQYLEYQTLGCFSNSATGYPEAYVPPVAQQRWQEPQPSPQNGPQMYDTRLLSQPFSQTAMPHGGRGSYLTYPSAETFDPPPPYTPAPPCTPAQPLGRYEGRYEGQCPQAGYPGPNNPPYRPYQTQNPFICAPAGHSYGSRQRAPTRNQHHIPVRDLGFSDQDLNYRRGQTVVERNYHFEPLPMQFPQDWTVPVPPSVTSEVHEPPEPQSGGTTARIYYEYSGRSSAANRAARRPPGPRRADETDRRLHGIPDGYSLKNWDPTERPILFLGSVFDANTIGKWIYDWTVFRHGPSTPMSEMSGDIWLLLVQLSHKIKLSEQFIRQFSVPEAEEQDEDVAMMHDFVADGGGLLNKLRRYLRRCENLMLKKRRKETGVLGYGAGKSFVDAFFGPDRNLGDTEKLMQHIRLWNLKWDIYCDPGLNAE